MHLLDSPRRERRRGKIRRRLSQQQQQLIILPLSVFMPGEHSEIRGGGRKKKDRCSAVLHASLFSLAQGEGKRVSVKEKGSWVVYFGSAAVWQGLETSGSKGGGEGAQKGKEGKLRSTILGASRGVRGGGRKRERAASEAAARFPSPKLASDDLRSIRSEKTKRRKKKGQPADGARSFDRRCRAGLYGRKGRKRRKILGRLP